MKFTDIIDKSRPFSAWLDAEKIPWNEPLFSERMLQNHLAQEHDWASRRFAIIDQHVNWIDSQLPAEGRILDIGCGPGFYLQRLAQKGFQCTGVDFSPASIRYARQQAASAGLDISYHCQDIRQFKAEATYDFIMMTFGEFNVFSKAESLAILNNAANWLKPGGQLIIEVHTEDEIKRQGESENHWGAHQQGLFSIRPHLLLTENAWDEQQRVASTAWWVLEQDGEVSLFASHMQAWSNEEYRQSLNDQGIGSITQLTDTAWPAGEIFTGKLFVLHGVKHP
ncbi:class I SAM-dependent methyltransferase [Serratia aquatilis]|uniref:Class I SAM-dependent methyltransferase n=1 Tax=Serratia aquatilis TaxID=1737515 RepID=A0ABV6EC92_9GAMM